MCIALACERSRTEDALLQLGSITPGKKADFAVFDRDFIRGEPRDILKARCLGTVVGGGLVYGHL